MIVRTAVVFSGEKIKRTTPFVIQITMLNTHTLNMEAYGAAWWIFRFTAGQGGIGRRDGKGPQSEGWSGAESRALGRGAWGAGAPQLADGPWPSASIYIYLRTQRLGSD